MALPVDPRLTATALAAALSLAGASARAQVAPSATTAIYFRAGFAMSILDPSAMNFTAVREREARRNLMPQSFSGKQLGWSRDALPGASLGVALDARWFYLRIGAELYPAPAITVQPGRYSADVVTMGWASLGPRYAWGSFAIQAGARVGAVVTSLRSLNGGAEYSAVSGTYAAEAGFQWRPLRWLEVDAAVAQDFSGLGVTTLTLAANIGWARRP